MWVIDLWNANFNVHPKVAFPAFAGLVAALACCIADHWGVHLDFGLTIGCIVVGMILLGWATPNGKVNNVNHS